MSPLPRYMQDRWANRAEPPPGEGTIYWHMLMAGHPGIQSMARVVQDKLASLGGFHFTPIQWLHMTTLIAGDTSTISPKQMRAMVDRAQEILGSIDPISVSVGKLLYHPEAIMLRAAPQHALSPVLEAAREATRSQTGDGGELNGALPVWTPHVTIAYSTADQPAEPIIQKLGMSAGNRAVRIDALSLVVQWGPERLWDWEIVGTVEIGARKTRAQVG